MTFRRNLALLLCCVLAACGGETSTVSPAGNWRALLAAGDGAGAEAALRATLDDSGTAAELAPYLGEAALLQGDLAQAEYWLEAGDFAPGVAPYGLRMLGRLRMRQGDLAAAAQAFDRALTIAREDPELWVDIARLRWRGGEHLQALAAADTALGHGPDNSAAMLLNAQLKRDSRGNAAAVPLLVRALAAAPNHPDLLAELAATLGELGRAKDMLAATRRLSEAAPGNPRALYLQAVLASRAGNRELARSLLLRSGDLDRGVPAAALLLALLDTEDGNYASAAQGLDRLSRQQPDNRRVRLLLARALALDGNHRELIARFADGAAEPYVAELVGRSYEALGERAKAAPFLDRAAAAGPMRVASLPTAGVGALRGANDGAGLVALVRQRIAEGQTKEARASARAFLSRHAGSADALGLAGDAALADGDPRAAIGHYRRAATVRRSWPLARRMAVALDRSGDRAGGTALIAEHLAGEPANADAAAMLGRRLLDAGEEARAADLIEYAQRRGRNDPVLAHLREG